MGYFLIDKLFGMLHVDRYGLSKLRENIQLTKMETITNAYNAENMNEQKWNPIKIYTK